jgi:hypothetical protein
MYTRDFKKIPPQLDPSQICHFKFEIAFRHKSAIVLTQYAESVQVGRQLSPKQSGLKGEFIFFSVATKIKVCSRKD